MSEPGGASGNPGGATANYLAVFANRKVAPFRSAGVAVWLWHVLVTVTFAWSFSLNRSSPGSSKRSSGALSATLAIEPGLARGTYLAF